MRTVTLFLLCAAACNAQTLNLSHDLTAKGIATSNMTPNQPTLDSRPLIQAAITYSQKNGITTLTADPGAYYFLTLQNNLTHILLNNASNLTLDFQNSDLYFKNPGHGAILCQSCIGVTLQNFTVDYMTLPFTQLTVTSVDSTNRKIGFTTMAGYPQPSSFNNGLAANGGDSYVGFFFRNGVPITQTGRMPVNTPVTGTTIAFTGADPWANSSAISAVQPGDVFVYTDRGGPHTVHFDSSTNCAVHNVAIYAGGAMGLTFPSGVNTVVDHVEIIPRPGTNRLISTNADGIHGTFAGPNSSITDNIVRRTCDDSLAYDAPWVATVSANPNGASIKVQRYSTLAVPIGASLSFVDPNTETVIGTASVVSESPALANQTLAAGETFTITLDKAPNGIANGMGVIANDPTQHGAGSVMQYNLVQQGVFSRGIWLSGVTNVSVHDNFVQQTSKTGIFVQQLNGGGALNGPSSNITIINNLVDNAINYGGPSIGPIVTAASIHTVSEDSNAEQVNSTPHSNITITGNRITNSPRTAIRLENVNGGSISNNIIQGYGLNPSLNLYLIPGCCETQAQYLADFSMPLLITNTMGLANSGNAITVNLSNLISISSTASGVPKVAPGSIVAAYGSNLGSTTAINVTDSQGTTQPATVNVATPNQVNFYIPDTAAPGIATVTIGQQSGGVLIDKVAPGLYSADSTGSGVAAAGAAIYSTSGNITPQNVATCSASGCVAVPLDFGGPGDQLIITLYGTGLRGFSTMAHVSASVGGAMAQVLYTGPQGQFAGLDQVNVVVPASLAGVGEVPVILRVDGQTANVVTINLK
ncbi:MAG TPA: hypothetical protein VGL72_08830 [Bryobacteraceae bacterium]|jgi:uncharacterized protein (TIGR03437 family)